MNYGLENRVVVARFIGFFHQLGLLLNDGLENGRLHHVLNYVLHHLLCRVAESFGRVCAAFESVNHRIHNVRRIVAEDTAEVVVHLFESRFEVFLLLDERFERLLAVALKLSGRRDALGEFEIEVPVGFDEVFVFGDLCQAAIQVAPLSQTEESRFGVPGLDAEHAQPIVVALGLRVDELASALPLLFLFEFKAIVGERLNVALDASLDVVLPVLCEKEGSARLRQLVRTEDRFEVAGFALFGTEEFVVLQLLVVDLLLNVEQRLLVYGGRLKGFRHVAEYLHCPGFNRPDHAALRKALADVRHGAHCVHQPLGLFGHVLTACGFEERGELRRDFPDLVGCFGGGCP